MARILIIDDEPQMRAMLRQMLERAGYEVMDAPDGDEGIRLYRQDQADLIIMDILMPEKEGLETIMELRNDFPDVKIFAVSGGGRRGKLNYLSYASDFGALRTFTKPFEREELLRAVEEVLGEGRKEADGGRSEGD